MKLWAIVTYQVGKKSYDAGGIFSKDKVTVNKNIQPFHANKDIS